MDCGPTCLSMVAQFHGRHYSLQYLRDRAGINREGVSLGGISDAAEAIGLATLPAQLTLAQLEEHAPLPCIVHWNQEHFVVVYKITRKSVYVADPGHGRIKFSRAEFRRYWLGKDKVNDPETEGIVLLLEPGPDFMSREGEEVDRKGFRFLFRYLTYHRRLLIQVVLGLVLGSLIQLAFPFLTQAIVDFGINFEDLNFIYIVLAAQLMLVLSRSTVDFIRGWIVLFVGARINIRLISDFLIKLMKLPISYFDTKLVGDLMQRINDHTRIEEFLTTTVMNIAFSVFNIVIFGAILAWYNLGIFFAFLIGTVLYIIWIVAFLQPRKHLDVRRFDVLRNNHETLYQLFTGMQEIKMHNSEKHYRWQWERIQARLYRINIRFLKLNQSQRAGGIFINELKNVFITFIAAKAVMDGEITLGMMLAIQYIIGQLNSPIDQMVGFFHSAQDAKLSLQRLAEIHDKDNEAEEGEVLIHDLPESGDIQMENVSFSYPGTLKPVLRDIQMEIGEGKVTAIVGSSGSGKTTLLKLLMKFYAVNKGHIRLGEESLDMLDTRMWRESVGAVMQDGFIFSDTIERNIAVGTDEIDRKRLSRAVEVANIRPFIEDLPLGFRTKIGAKGIGVSQGQKQRILIARAVYKNPRFIFFDEATNALDANNEKVIMEQLEQWFKGKTVIVVAHRLSTVRNADQILVLNQGEIVERGTHEELTELKGFYYQLVKNQLELGA